MGSVAPDDARPPAPVDMIRRDADRYARRVREAADREAAERRAKAEQEARAILRAAQLRAREESDSILNHARQRLADVLRQPKAPVRRLPYFGTSMPPGTEDRPSAPVIDMRSRAEVSSTLPIAPIEDDPLDAIVERAVTAAVRRSMRPRRIIAGRFAEPR